MSGEKRPVGRPRAFQTEKDLQDALKSYFDWAERERKPLTMARLIVHIDVCEDTFGDYARGKYDDEDNNFSDTIKKARKTVEADKLENMLSGDYNATAAIFDLKNNHGYADKQEITGRNGKDLSQTVIVLPSKDE